MSKEPTRSNEIDDDLDDLDDVLDEFTISPSSPKTETTKPFGNRPRHNTRVDAPPTSIPGTGPKLGSTVVEEDLDAEALSAEFAKELEKGMESLMRDITNGLDIGDIAESSSSGQGTHTNDFQSRIKQAMDKLKESESNFKSGSGAGPGAPANPESLEELMKSLEGLGLAEGDGDEAELAGFLENMMGQLMSKEVLYEPLKELSDKFPEYLSNPPKPLNSEEKTRYEKQFFYVKQIIQIFEKPDYSDTNDEDKKTIMELMSEMQNLGSPPSEIMGPLPPGFENGMSGDENCVIS